MVTLIFSLLGWGIIPLGPVLDLSDFSLGILPSLSRIPVFGVFVFQDRVALYEKFYFFEK